MNVLDLQLQTDDAGPVRLTVRGELDLFTRPALAEQLAQLERRAGDVVLDLRAVSFMDCGGLALVLGAQARSPVQVVGPDGEVAQMLLAATGAKL